MNPSRSYPANYGVFVVLSFVLWHQFERSETRIIENPLRDRIYRSWSEWSSWSSCSRSCGLGVAERTRICRVRLSYHHRIPFSRKCVGESVQHKLCEKQSCPLSDEDFVSYQCSLHNGHLIGGKMILEWIPYKRNDNPCELQCQAKDGSRLYSFGKVIDGTECSSKYQAICVNGRCTNIDCSGQLGTDNQLDMCGVCRGDNSTCVRYQNSYWGRPRKKNSGGTASATDQHYDYNHIARIPSGATKILIKESSETNYLALMDKMGKIVINGNWRVASPGALITAGTEFIYSRMSNGEDILSAPGPTESNLFILILGKGDIPTVEYEYWYSKKSEQSHFDSRQRRQYYISEEKDASSLRRKNKYPYEGYRSYYHHRNAIIPTQYEAKLHQHNHSQLSSAALKALDQNETEVGEEIASVISSSAAIQYAPKSEPSVSIIKNMMKPRQPLKEPAPSPSTGEVQLNSKEASANNAVVFPSTGLPLEVTPPETLPPKGVYISKVPPSSEGSHLFPNVTTRGKSHQNALVTPFTTTTSVYTVPSKFTHSNHRIPSGLMRHRYEMERSLRNLSSTQISFLNPPQLCTKRPGVLEVLLNQHIKRQRTEIHSDALEPPNQKEKKGFPAVAMFTYTERDRKDNGKMKSNHKGVPDMKSKKKKRKRKSNKDHCLPCSRVKQQTKNFCNSDFVLRIIVTSAREVKGETQFEMQVIQSYMNKIPILPREYLWRLRPCKCPRLHLGREYIVMGYLGASTTRNGESRLYVDRKSFVRRYAIKRASSILRLARDKDIVCRKFVSSDQ